jgi:hypothetical protein
MNAHLGYKRRPLAKKGSGMDMPGVSQIMIEIDQPKWTLEALHLACAVARVSSWEVVLVKMVPVAHISWLGTELGYQNFSIADEEFLRVCLATAEDYGITASVRLFQYVTLSDGIADAAEYFDTQFVFATLPYYRLPGWRRFLMWRLRRQLAERGRSLYTLDRPPSSADWAPQILVPPSHLPEKAN